MLVGQCRYAPTSGRAVQKTDLHQVRFVNILDGDRLLTHRCGKRIQSHRSSAEGLDNRLQHPPVNGVQAQLVHLQRPQRIVGDGSVDGAVAHDLRKIPHTLQKPVCDTRSSA